MSPLSHAGTSEDQLTAVENGADQPKRRRGRLVALKTKAEVRQAHVQTTKVYVIAVPLKSASAIRRCLTQLFCRSFADQAERVVDNAVRELESSNLHHLRRFVKPEHLPLHLQSDKEPEELIKDLGGLFARPAGDQNDIIDLPVKQLAKSSEQPILHFLICSTSIISQKDLQILFSSANLPLGNHHQPQIRTTFVPLNVPTSHEQAKAWSKEYWPAVYKGGNPNGPHPSLLARATAEIQHGAGTHMALATRAALATSAASLGEAIGAVVVDRSGSDGPSIIVVAGDARWHSLPPHKEGGEGNGNPMAHATMRAIGMVAKQRLALSNGGSEEPATGRQRPNVFADLPITSLEKDICTTSTLAPGGYLCVDLELYLTHEPCVMCSMAILHSRFARVVFGRHMPRTGGMAAEYIGSDTANIGINAESSGYGLWWRPELNWKLLAWQWIDDDDSMNKDCEDQKTHA